MKKKAIIFVLSIIPLFLIMFPIPKLLINILFGLDIFWIGLMFILYPRFLKKNKETEFLIWGLLGWIFYNIGLLICICRNILVTKDYYEQIIISRLLFSSVLTTQNIIITIIIFLIVSFTGYFLIRKGTCIVKNKQEENKNNGIKEELELLEELHVLIRILNATYVFILCVSVVIIFAGTLIGYLKWGKPINTTFYENILLGAGTGCIFEFIIVLVNFVSCNYFPKLYKSL